MRYFVLGLACVAVCLVVNVATYGDAGVEVIIKSGDAAPDGNGVFDTFAGPSLNDVKQAGLFGILSGTTGGATDSYIVVRATADGLTKIARGGETLPGGDTIGQFTLNTGINEQGDILATATVDVGGSLPEFVGLIGNGGVLDVFPRGGSPSPTGSGNIQGGASFPTITESGVSAFWAYYVGGPTLETGIFRRNAGGSITTLLLDDAPAPRGGVFSNVFLELPHINESSQVVFSTPATDNGQTMDSVVFIDDTTVSEIIREGDLLADGITTLDSLIDFTNTPINNAGQVAFAGDFSQPGKSGHALFLADTGGVVKLTDGVLPGAPSTIDFPSIFGFNEAGQVAFHTGFLFGNDDAVYISDTSGTTLVAIEGTPTPDGGKYFQRIDQNSLSMNEAGQVAFAAGLADTPDALLSNGEGLFLYDPVDGLRQLLTNGDVFDGSTIEDILLLGSTGGTATRADSNTLSGLNNLGDIAFRYTLTDQRSGIAIWSDSLAGDLNGDGFVGIADLNLVLGNWNQNVTPGALTQGDPSGDGFVGIADLNVVLGNWNTGTPPGAGSVDTVPEPGVGVLLGGLLGVLCLGKRGGSVWGSVDC